MKTIELHDVLDETQLNKLLAAISNMRGPATEPRNVNVLKALFQPWRQQLEQKEIDPDYLAYAIAYLVATQSFRI